MTLLIIVIPQGPPAQEEKQVLCTTIDGGCGGDGKYGRPGFLNYPNYFSTFFLTDYFGVRKTLYNSLQLVELKLF